MYSMLCIYIGYAMHIMHTGITELKVSKSRKQSMVFLILKKKPSQTHYPDKS